MRMSRRSFASDAAKDAWVRSAISVKLFAMQHPFQELNLLKLQRATLLVSALLTGATAIFLVAVPLEHFLLVVQLIGAPTGDVLHLISGWTIAERQSFAFMIGYDFVFDLLHNSAAALFVIWGAARLNARSACPNELMIAAWLAWAMWLCSGLNIVENLAFLHLLESHQVTPWHLIGKVAFTFRGVALVAAFVTGLVFHLRAGIAVPWRARLEDSALEPTLK